MKPKFKKNDRCIFIYYIGKNKILSVLDDNMIVENDPIWNEERKEWMYPILGKSNPSPESLLQLYKNQKIGDIIK